jgi:hypothetical protein
VKLYHLTNQAEHFRFAVEESPERGYTACALGRPTCTQAETVEELKAIVRDAIRCH